MRRRLPRVTATAALILALAGVTLLPAGTAAAAPPSPAPAGATTGAGSADHHAGAGLVARTPVSQLRAATARADATTVTGIKGVDVSGHQGNVDWRAAYNAGARFAIVKATEGTGFRNGNFAQQYNGSHNVGMIRGAYHFALPSRSSGTVQADFFVNNGGAWTADGTTLPPALDIEYNPYRDGTNTCYGMSAAAMVTWIRQFTTEVLRRTGRYPMIYTTTDWWRACTGNSAAFTTSPLWIARYAAGPGRLPAGWTRHAVWQYAWQGPMPGDQNVFNGSWAQLRALASRSDVARITGTVPARVAVGSSSTRVPWTVRASVPTVAVSMSVANIDTGRPVVSSTAQTSPAQRTVTSWTTLPTSALRSWGTHRWTARSLDTGASTSGNVDIRDRSLLGMAISRSAAGVRVFGAAKFYDLAPSTYRPLANRTVRVQRWSAAGWIPVTSAQTDRSGHIELTISVSWRIGLRLVSSDSASIFGATSSAAAI